eukprot:8532543-Pyramimonas_sp.AAC.1
MGVDELRTCFSFCQRTLNSSVDGGSNGVEGRRKATVEKEVEVVREEARGKDGNELRLEGDATAATAYSLFSPNFGLRRRDRRS